MTGVFTEMTGNHNTSLLVAYFYSSYQAVDDSKIWYPSSSTLDLQICLPNSYANQLVLVVAMSDNSHSAIQPWLDFRGDNLSATITPCDSSGINNYSCIAVCNNTQQILESKSANNLLTCGLWATLHLYEYFNTYVNPSLFPETRSFMNHFDSLGLDAADSAYGFMTMNAVSRTLSHVEQRTRMATYQAEPSSAGACNQQFLFPLIATVINDDLSKPLRDCVDAICTPRSLNPDLGGVGVSYTAS